MHEEEQGISSASSLSLFTFPLTSKIIQILTNHVTTRRVYVVILTNVWSI